MFDDTSLLLIDKKTSFSSRSTISFCLNAMNDESTLMMLKMTLTTGGRNFLSRPRSRLTDSMSTIESVCSEVDSIGESIDDSIDDEISDSIDDSVDESDNSSLLSA